MKAIVCNNKIRCDVPGCMGISTVYLNKHESSHKYDSIKLCSECAKGILTALKLYYKNKEKTDGSNAKN